MGSTNDGLKKRNRDNYPVQRPTDTPRTENRFTRRTAKLDIRIEELLKAELDQWAAPDRRVVVIASRFDPRPVAEALVRRLSDKNEYLVRIAGDSSFEESDAEKLLVDYRQEPQTNDSPIIVENAREGNLSPGIDQLLTGNLGALGDELAQLGVRVIVALTLTKPRGVALIRHSLHEINWHQRWLDDLARRAQVPRDELGEFDNLLRTHVSNGSALADEIDHRIFISASILTVDAENKSISRLKSELREAIATAVRGEAVTDTGRVDFSRLLRGDSSEAPDEILRVMLLVAAFGNGPRLPEFRALCETLLQPGTVEHVDQLPPGMREKAATQMLAAQSSGQEIPLPSWYDVLERTFDTKLQAAGLKITNGRVYFAERWSAISPRDEIVEHHPHLIKIALDRVIARGALHQLPLSLARNLIELFARSQQILDEELLAAALASVPGREIVIPESTPEREIVENTVAVAKWLAETSRRLGELLAVFALITGASREPDHSFWRLVGDLRVRWRTDFVSSQVLEGGLFVVLSRANSATAPALVATIYDIFDRTADPASRRNIIELMEGVADWACDTAEARPEMWLHGFNSSLPVSRRPDYRCGIASVAVERIAEFDIRWRAATYQELNTGTLAEIVFRTQESSGTPSLDQDAKTILDCLFGPSPANHLKSQLALAHLLDRDRSEEDSAADTVTDNVERRLCDVIWVLMTGISDREFSQLKPDIDLIFDDLIALLSQCSGVDRPSGLGDAAEEIVAAADQYDSVAQPKPRVDIAGRWLDMYALFRAAALTHWRFLLFGHAPIAPASAPATRIGLVLDYLIAQWPDTVEELCRSFSSLKQASEHLARFASGRRAPAAASVYQAKAAAFDKLGTALRKRSPSPGQRRAM